MGEEASKVEPKECGVAKVEGHVEAEGACAEEDKGSQPKEGANVHGEEVTSSCWWKGA